MYCCGTDGTETPVLATLNGVFADEEPFYVRRRERQARMNFLAKERRAKASKKSLAKKTAKTTGDKSKGTKSKSKKEEPKAEVQDAVVTKVKKRRASTGVIETAQESGKRLKVLVGNKVKRKIK